MTLHVVLRGWDEEVRFIRKGGAAVVAALMVLSVGAAYAQTQGMERRDERRDDRAGARADQAGLQGGRREDPGGVPPREAHGQARRAARRWPEAHGSPDASGQ